MKGFALIGAFILCFCLNVAAQMGEVYVDTMTDGHFSEEDIKEVKERLANIESVVELKFTTAVKGYILGYVERNRGKSQRILGRMIKYFPLFEQKLAQNNMPDDLKYLAVVESALNPRAISRVGAGGLWQFMPETGASYGLQITYEKDDRFDPNKSTDAAIEYLRKAHDRFGSWELALAAYNSGGGRVNRAIKRARSKNFWKIQRFLPRETRNYVPAFIGATYLSKYYQQHLLTPEYPLLDIQISETIEFFSTITFREISDLTGVDLWIIEELNPSYKLGFIPYAPQGNFLTLPKRVMPAMIDYINKDRTDYVAPQINQLQSLSGTALTPPRIIHPDDNYYVSTFTLGQNEHLHEIAKTFNVSVRHLMSWNGLSHPYAFPGTELKIYSPFEYKRWIPSNVKVLQKLPTLSTKKLLKVKAPNTQVDYSFLKPFKKGKYLYHRLRRYETLLDIADQYNDVELSDIILLNKLDINNLPNPGTNIRIKKVK